MNLENLNLVELNAQELQETDGGKLNGWGYLGVAWVVFDFLSDVHDQFVKDYKPH